MDTYRFRSWPMVFFGLLAGLVVAPFLVEVVFSLLVTWWMPSLGGLTGGLLSALKAFIVGVAAVQGAAYFAPSQRPGVAFGVASLYGVAMAWLVMVSMPALLFNPGGYLWNVVLLAAGVGGAVWGAMQTMRLERRSRIWS